jgi:hypothetical protein
MEAKWKNYLARIHYFFGYYLLPLQAVGIKTFINSQGICQHHNGDYMRYE